MLADGFFAPLLAPGGALTGTLGPVFGVGSGRGVELLFAAMGLVKLLVATGAWLSPGVRGVERQGSEQDRNWQRR